MDLLIHPWLGQLARATTPEPSLHLLATDFRIDGKTLECPTLTGHPPLVKITPRDTALNKTEKVLFFFYFESEVPYDTSTFSYDFYFGGSSRTIFATLRYTRGRRCIVLK